MVLYRRTQVALTAFQTLTTKISSQTINIMARRTSSRIPQSRSPLVTESKNTTKLVSIFPRSSCSSISHRLLLPHLGRSSNPYILVGGKRFYYTHHHHRFPTRRWLESPRNVKMFLVVVGSGVVIITAVYLGMSETIPYSKRSHLVLLPRAVEKGLGEVLFKPMKLVSFRNKILPETHPDTVRVKSITKNIMEALQRDHKQEHAWNWEFLVVNKSTVNAFCLPGGKIVVFTGLLKHLKTDAEIATVLCHEVGHAVARHQNDRLIKTMWFWIMKWILSHYYVEPDTVHTMIDLFLWRPFSRKMEMEADYIGLLLMASAGYDPRVAPTVYDKFGKSSAIRDYLCTHPSGEKRARLLSQPQVMEEALAIYRQVKLVMKESKQAGYKRELQSQVKFVS